MSRHHPSLLWLAALSTLSILALAAAGCGEDSQEQALEEATAAVAGAREALQEARQEVEALQQAADEARKELDAAKSELRIREEALREAESHVGLKATDAALFRSVQRRLLDDEELENLAVRAEAAKGVITLQGTVPDQENRARAEEIASETPGVVAVENQIEVVPPPEED
jgi:osmotically-inducible protein OsmY